MNYAVILSGGVGSRVGSDIPKQYIEIMGKPIIVYTIEKFARVGAIDWIVIVAAEMWQVPIKCWIEKFCNDVLSKTKFALPGKTRQESVYNGLTECVRCGVSDSDKVIVHDAVRPMVGTILINEELDELSECEAVMPVVPVNDTVYQSTDGKIVEALLDRDTLFAGQSPEAFKLKRYYDIHCRQIDSLGAVRGSSELAFSGGMLVRMIDGDISNFKITTREDLMRFKQLVEK